LTDYKTQNTNMQNQDRTEIPNDAGESPASTHNSPTPWKPLVEIPSQPQSIETPVKNSDGCYPAHFKKP
jgi:hypothetical protein